MRSAALFSTNAAEVFDDAANREQLEQVSQQMEDAMQKEKQITQTPQVNGQTSSQMWDSNTQTAREPTDDRVSQSSSPEMDQINKEQRQANKRTDMGDLKTQANPVGFQTEAVTRDYYSHDKNYNVNNRKYTSVSNDANDNKNNNNNRTNMPNIDPNKVMEQVKDMASGAAGLAAGAVHMAAGVGQVVSETAKATMHNLQEMMPNAHSMNTTENSTWRKNESNSSGAQRRNHDGSLMEDTTKMMRETAKDLIDTMTHPTVTDNKIDEQLRQQQEQRDRQGTNTGGGAGATQAGEETQETSAGKKFSEHRQNSSLL
jgi:hypothetical protein